MLRPGLLELLAHLRAVGATIVVYTHSEEKWAIKVAEQARPPDPPIPDPPTPDPRPPLAALTAARS
jgi:hypothetical protein